MKRYLLLIGAWLLASIAVKAQNVAFEKSNFPDRKSEFKEAVKNLENGLELYANGAWKMDEALELFLLAQAFNPNNANLNFKIGMCYLNSKDEKTSGIGYFEHALELDPKVSPEIHYRIGQVYQLSGKWDKAVDHYQTYRNQLKASNSSLSKIEWADKVIAECEMGKQLADDPARVFIDNLGGVVNSKFPEYSPVITTDESMMMFTSRRATTTGGEVDEFTNEFYEDIYYTEKVNDTWTNPKNLGKPVNTKYHDATVGLSPDGQQLLTFMDGDIYSSYLKGLNWSKPKKLIKNINSEHHESSASLSFDGQTLYFISERPQGSFGGRDIWFSEWINEKTGWGPAKNMGANINTRFDEESVFIHPDGKTLYFSSKGHSTMGGYDIFKSVLENGRWSAPENIGHPINTPGDELSFVMAASGEHGYYASSALGGLGQRDLYLITFLGPEKQVMLNTEDNLLASRAEPVREVVIEPTVEVSTAKVTIFKGIVTDAATGEPIEARIEVYDNAQTTRELAGIASAASNSTSGKFLVPLPSGKNYGIAVKAPGYLFHSENFIIPESAAYKEVVKTIQLQRLEVGKAIVLKNIFFDSGKSDLRPESTIELTNVYELMKDNPTLKVEISGHTDNVGSNNANQSLSEQRAQAVVNYLLELGITTDRMSFKGYGETAPIATNDTEEGRQENRRTEFKVLAK